MISNIYADLLKRSGNKVKLVDLEEIFHGFLALLPENAFAQQAFNHVIDEFNKSTQYF